MRECDQKPVRTNQQNAALHKYCSMLSDEFNNAGYDVRTTLSQDIEIPWTPTLIKELIFKKVMTAHYPEITSTTKLDTAQVSVIYEIINRYTAEKHGVSVEFPDSKRENNKL